VSDARINGWLEALETRHLADLTTSEVTRALRALSSCYVERRGRLRSGAALDGAGKRAAFALYYAPLHLLTIRAIVHDLALHLPTRATLVDLGCGSGAAGAGWALALPEAPRLLGVERHPWAVRETEWSWRTLGLPGHVIHADLGRIRWPRDPFAIVVGYAANELPEATRSALRDRLLDVARAGRAVLVVEPLAGAVAPWWRNWTEAFASVGGRADEWRLALELPAVVKRFDRAAGLDHRVVKARSISVLARSG
jgi:hypothetical protein